MLSYEEKLVKEAKEWGYQQLFYTPTDEEFEEWIRTRKPGAVTKAEVLALMYSIINHFAMKVAKLEVKK